MRIPTVSRLPIPNLGRLQCNYSPTIALFSSQKDMLASNSMVDRLKVENDISRAQPDQLRWKVVSNTSHKALPLSTQRNRLRRRWTAAFQESLKKQGLNRHGKREGEFMQMPNVAELSGTFELLIFEAFGFNESAEELATTTNKIVEALLRAGQGSRRLNIPRQDGGWGQRRGRY